MGNTHDLPGEAFRLVARLTWYQDDRASLPSAPGEEIGLYLSGSVQLAMGAW